MVRNLNRHRPTSATEQDDRFLERVREAIAELARDGRIIDTGRRKYSKRTGRYEIVWAAVPTGPKCN
jgi:hypothetical protein